ncbi:hypothetical protein LSUCC0246_12105, partial [Rhodobacterales bacterium LSUCC0246]|nr:hypothetical protein [Rhodobacterales bacterium LSUCC0374]
MWVIALFLLCFSAAVQAQQISLPASGTPNTLNQLVEAIEAQSDYRVVYNAGKINMDTQIAEVATPQDLTTLLKNLFKSLPYTYELKGKQVML